MRASSVPQGDRGTRLRRANRPCRGAQDAPPWPELVAEVALAPHLQLDARRCAMREVEEQLAVGVSGEACHCSSPAALSPSPPPPAAKRHGLVLCDAPLAANVPRRTASSPPQQGGADGLTGAAHAVARPISTQRRRWRSCAPAIAAARHDSAAECASRGRAGGARAAAMAARRDLPLRLPPCAVARRRHKRPETRPAAARRLPAPPAAPASTSRRRTRTASQPPRSAQNAAGRSLRARRCRRCRPPSRSSATCSCVPCLRLTLRDEPASSVPRGVYPPPRRPPLLISPHGVVRIVAGCAAAGGAKARSNRALSAPGTCDCRLHTRGRCRRRGPQRRRTPTRAPTA